MNETDLQYPADTCPFCTIAAVYPFPGSEAKPGLWQSKKGELGRCVPGEQEVGVERTEPSSFVVLRSKDVVAFLDILPMTAGELCFCYSIEQSLLGHGVKGQKRSFGC